MRENRERFSKKQPTCKTYSAVQYASIKHDKNSANSFCGINNVPFFNVGKRSVNLADKSNELKATSLFLSSFLPVRSKRAADQPLRWNTRKGGALLIGCYSQNQRHTVFSCTNKGRSGSSTAQIILPNVLEEHRVIAGPQYAEKLIHHRPSSVCTHAQGQSCPTQRKRRSQFCAIRQTDYGWSLIGWAAI